MILQVFEYRLLVATKELCKSIDYHFYICIEKERTYCEVGGCVEHKFEVTSDVITRDVKPT